MDGGTLPARQSPVEQLLTKLYGDLPLAERFRVLWLSGTLFCIIGGYWLLRSLKDPIVSSMMGIEVMLIAKHNAHTLELCL
jgi:ATP:ADP antiporter, AAA family